MKKWDSKGSGKNIEKARAAVEERPYSLDDAVSLLQKVKFAKFDETVDLTLRLGVDPKHADQMVRGTVVLPHGLGKSKKVLVIASGEKAARSRSRRRRHRRRRRHGGEDSERKLDRFRRRDRHPGHDAVRRPPGKVLGPRGLMPNPKTGTVTFDMAKAVQEVKAGKVEFRTDKTALVHVPVARFRLSPTSWSRTRARWSRRGQSQAGGRQRQVHQGLHPEFDHGAGRVHRYRARLKPRRRCSFLRYSEAQEPRRGGRNRQKIDNNPADARGVCAGSEGISNGCHESKKDRTGRTTRRRIERRQAWLCGRIRQADGCQ